MMLRLVKKRRCVDPDPPLVVVEHAQGGAKTRVPVGNVRDTDDGLPSGEMTLRISLHEEPGVDQVLEDVGGEHDVEVSVPASAGMPSLRSAS